MKIYTKILSLFLCFVLVFVCASCSENNSEYPVVINEVSINSAPSKVASLSDSANSVIKYFGYDDRLVLGEFGTPLNVNTKNIIDAKVSLLITPSELASGTKKELTKNGVEVVTVSLPETYEQLKEYYKTIGSIMGGNKTGMNVAKDVLSDIDESLNNINKFLDKKETFSYVFFYEEGYAANSNSFVNDMLSRCGGVNKVKEQNALSLEELKELNPSTIIVPQEMKQLLLDNKDLSELSAVKNNKIIEIDVNAFNDMGIDFINCLYEILENQYPDFLKGKTQE